MGDRIVTWPNALSAARLAGVPVFLWLVLVPRTATADLIGAFLRAVAFRDGRTYRLEPTRANGQLAFETYLPGAVDPSGLLVLTLDNSKRRIRVMTRFRRLPMCFVANIT